MSLSGRPPGHVPAAAIFEFNPNEWVPVHAITHFKRLPNPKDYSPVLEPLSDDEMDGLNGRQRPPDEIISAGGFWDTVYQWIGGSFAHCETEFLCRRKTRDAGWWCETGALTSITIQCTIVDKTRPVLKVSHDDAMWVSIAMNLSRSELQWCYDYQTSAIGTPYNSHVAMNFFYGMICCGCCSEPTKSTTYFCSELVAASIYGFACYPRRRRPNVTNPEQLLKEMQEMGWISAR
jgi:hypothetical protein